MYTAAQALRAHIECAPTFLFAPQRRKLHLLYYLLFEERRPLHAASTLRPCAFAFAVRRLCDTGRKIQSLPALLPLPILSGAVVVLYLCGVAGFLRVGAVAVLLALAAVWVVGLVQYRPAGVAAAWKRAASVPGFTLIFRRCCVYLAAVLCTAADVYPVG